MEQPVIEISGLYKSYKLGEFGTGTISHDLNRWWTMLWGKEDPYAKLGRVNDRTSKADKGESVLALRDINLNVSQGEVLGIIGNNGAGKSTLLKVLSRVTSPTKGSVKIRGRMASLLEVGTGFHPEMTGRENIYMNGTIMGMRKWEIDKKLDEIVDFAGIVKYLDTPTKRYSSGMTVRLGFAIAAFLEPEILIVDEVLAVGDAEFQKKAIGKMKDVSKVGGRTVLFVSHNMNSVRSLCTRGLIVDQGAVAYVGEISDVVNKYISSFNQIIHKNEWLRNEAPGTDEIKVISAHVVFPHKAEEKQLLRENDPIMLQFKIDIRDNTEVELDFTISVIDEMNNKIFVSSTVYDNVKRIYTNGLLTIDITIPANILMVGKYRIGKFIVLKNGNIPLFGVADPLSFEIMSPDGVVALSEKIGIIKPKIDWKVATN